MAKKGYIETWLSNWWDVFSHELRDIFSDGGVLLIFFVAGLAYPLLYNVVYLNGILSETPIAVVDEAACPDSRRFIREIDATREVEVAAKCVNMAEAEKLMQERKVNGIVYFPKDFGEKLARNETATLSLYGDMSSFLYYKNAMIATNFVMLHEIGQIQMERYSLAGMTEQEASQVVKPVGYEDNNPYNRAFDYSFFLISAILMIIIQQTMFYGMSLLVGTRKEKNRNFSSLPAHYGEYGIMRIVLGRGGAYWLLYLGIGLYIAFIVPAIFGLPQRGQFMDILALLLFFVTDCVFFSMTWCTLITRRESVFLLFLAISPICLFLTGCSWPTIAFPKFWKVFSYIFPSTFGVQGYMNLSTAGGDISAAGFQMRTMVVQTIIYFLLACASINHENWVTRHIDTIRDKRDDLAQKVGIDREEDARIIKGV
ncbi:MAG: ABC transporter permease [Bacteroidales bacterium]|nr:ABC transporter permease [Bacteroidales bacterium]